MLFSNTCKKIILTKTSDLNEIIKYLEHFTSERNNNTTAHELASFYIFLINSLKIQKLTFPVEIIKDESPDFRLSRINEEPYLGLEHTRATVEKYKMDESELENYPEGSLIELPYYTINNSPSKKSNVAIKKPGEPLTSPGYGDYGIEKQWTEIILHSLNKKTQLLNTKKFEKYERNELLIEDDSPAPIFGKYENGIKILKKTYSQMKINVLFTYDKVHIFSSNILIYDVFCETIIKDMSKSQLKK